MRRQCDCGATIPVSEGPGRPRRYCSTACRKRAYRRRKAVPRPMRCSPRWVRFTLENRNGRTTKVPRQLNGRHASVRDPRHWASYTAARNSTVGAGVGWVLGEGVGCIDLDHAFDSGGHLAPWAAEIIRKYRSRALLIERSISGEGIHIFMRMKPGAGRRIRDGRNIEVYPPDSGRYIAVTADRFELDEPSRFGRLLRPCGTTAAARRHRRRGETACEACREAENTARRAAEAAAEARALEEAVRAAERLPEHLSITDELRGLYAHVRRALADAAPEDVSALTRQGAELLEKIASATGCSGSSPQMSRNVAPGFAS